MKIKRFIRRKRGECAYCGTIGPLTRDHVPPRNLFPKMPPKNLLTVPCCDSCNQEASRDDEYFRLVVAPRADLHAHPVVREILPKVLRSLAYPEQEGLRDAFLKGLKRMPTFTPSGLYTGHRGAYDVNLRRVDAVVARIVKGILYKRNKRRLPNGYGVRAFSYDGLAGLGLHKLAELGRMFSGCFTAMRPEIYRNSVLECEWVAPPVDPYCTVWHLRIYGQVHFFALTGPDEHDARGASLQRGLRSRSRGDIP